MRPILIRCILLAVMLAALPCVCSVAQSRAYKKAMDQLSRDRDSNSFTLTKEAFGLLQMFNFGENGDLKKLVDDMDHMVIVKFRGGADFWGVSSEAFENAGFKEIDIRKHVGYSNQVHLYVNRTLLHISEAHVVFGGAGGAVVSVFGHFKFKDIRRLVRSAQSVRNSH